MLDIDKCKRCANYCVIPTPLDPKLRVENAGFEIPGNYNPNPSCYCYELTGVRPTILTPEKCFRPRKKVISKGEL